MDDSGTGLHEGAQLCLFADDLGVVSGVRCRGNRGDERVEVGEAADSIEFTDALELRAYRHGIGGFPLAEEIKNDTVNGGVSRAVVVRWHEDFNHIRDRILGEHHAAKNRHFGINVLGRGPLKL